MNRLFTDPVLLGRYPDLMADAPFVRPEDLPVIASPIDFLGVNYYHPTRLTTPAEGPLPFGIADITEYPTTGMGWPIVPDAFLSLLRTLDSRYEPPPLHHATSSTSRVR